MKHSILIFLIITPFLLSCGENGGGGQHNGTTAEDFSFASPLVSKIEVSSGGTLIETYEFSYDDKARLSSLTHTDCLQKNKLLALDYSYTGSEMTASGTFYPLSSKRFISATLDKEQKTLSYKGSWSGALSYVTSFDGGGTATATVSDSDFSAKDGQYSSATRYSETYSVTSGCISTATMGNEIEARSSKRTKTTSVAAFSYSYSYSGNDDKQNFSAFLIPCNFPVWYAAGLPGCKKLITGISSARGGVASAATTTIKYGLTPEGNIDTAVRTDLNDGQEILVRTYKFYYQ